MIRALTLTNFLSFGAKPTTLELRPMNVLIGPNASGKTNLLRALRLLSAVPSSSIDMLRAEGVQDWVYKSAKRPPVARLQVSLDLAVEDAPVERYDYTIAFDVADPAKPVVAEEILVRVSDGSAVLESRRGSGQALQMVDQPMTTDRSAGTWKFDRMDPYTPFLQQVRSPRNYPAPGALAAALTGWAFYGDTSLETAVPRRLPQRADLQSDRLLEDGSNLAAVLHERGADKAFRQRLREAMNGLYEDYEDFHVQIIPPSFLQLIVYERRPWGQVKIPATRLSDGTLDLLKLFAILADSDPPSLICIEEPEIGLHPDAISTLAKLLKDAATRTQLVVTTHSDALVDAFRDTPEDVVICERGDTGTTLRRLERGALAAWLEDYSLGSLWLRGDLGGTRW